MFKVDHTHDPALRSWVGSANVEGNDFPIQNLPHGVFRRRGTQENWRGGIAIGDQVLDLAVVAGRLTPGGAALEALSAARRPSLNDFMALGAEKRIALRRLVSGLLAAQATPVPEALVPQADCEFRLPRDDWRLFGLLCVLPARDQQRPPASAQQSHVAQLLPPPDRVPWPQLDDRRIR